MKLNIFEQMEIRSYFMLDNRIAETEERIHQLRESFYDQTMASYVTTDGLGLFSQGFSPEKTVIPFVDTIVNREKAVKRLKKKKRYFDDYLDTISEQDKLYLVNKYMGNELSKDVKRADIDVYEEIQEIEIAINFMYGYPQDFRLGVKARNSLRSNINSMAKLLGV